MSSARRLGPQSRLPRLLFGGVAWVCVTAALAAGCGRHIEDHECLALLDHYTELLVRSDRPTAGAAERARLKAEARAKAQRDPEFLRCSSAVSRAQFECAMSAHDVDSMERCLL